MDTNQPYPSPDSEENSAQGALEPILEPLPEEAQSLPQSPEEALTVTESEEETEAGQPQTPTEAQPFQEAGEVPPEEIEEEPAIAEDQVAPALDEGKPPLAKEESRISRFFRKALQWVIIGLVLVAAGAILVFVLVHQPVRQALDSTQTELQTVQEKYTQAESNLAAVQSELANTKTELQKSQEDLLQSTNQVVFLRVMSNINTARYALVKKEGASARVALLDAQTDLDKILESVSAADKELAVLLDVRLERAINNLAGDPKVTETDLNTMIQDMEQLEGLLFPEE